MEKGNSFYSTNLGFLLHSRMDQELVSCTTRALTHMGSKTESPEEAVFKKCTLQTEVSFLSWRGKAAKRLDPMKDHILHNF